MQLGARLVPKLIASRFEWLLKTMCDDGYADPAYKVFNIGEANKIPAYSSELAVSLEEGRHVKAIDRILTIAARERRRGRVHTSPIALRFVAPSQAYASMMHGRPTMMIELILAKGTRHGFDLLSVYERELADLGVRPHWGQVNDSRPEDRLPRALRPLGGVARRSTSDSTRAACSTRRSPTGSGSRPALMTARAGSRRGSRSAASGRGPRARSSG